jgi:hypothetical protein
MVASTKNRMRCQMRPDIALAQELRETKDWLAQHKRDPFLWLIILGPLALAAATFWWIVVFPPSDALRAISQVLPHTDITVITLQPKNFPSCRARKYIFGYDFAIRTEGARAEDVGRLCRDIINGGWVLAIDNHKFKDFQSP